jgi:two-component system NarL family response regulator
MDPIKLIIVDSEEVFREGIVKLLQEQSTMEVVFQGGSSQEAIEKCTRKKPDMVILDTKVEGLDTLQILKEIKNCSPDAKVIMIGRPDAEGNTLDFMKAGARALLSKSITVNDLIKSIELISSGKIIVSPVFVEKLLKEMSTETSEPERPQNESLLSEREMEIARLIARGATNKEIAGKLFITENTTKVHVKNILNKLELKNRQQLAAYAVMKEWIINNSDTIDAEIKEGTGKPAQ